MIAQRTLKKAIQAVATSPDSGGEVWLTLRPGAVDTGILLYLSDRAGRLILRISPRDIGATLRSLASVSNRGRLSAIRGLLSALAGLGIDNARVELTAQVFPFRAVSTGQLVNLLQAGGVEFQTSPKRFIRIRRRVEIKEGDSKAVLEPFDGFTLALSTDVDAPASYDSGAAGFASRSDAMVVDLSRFPAPGLLYGSKIKIIQQPQLSVVETASPSAQYRGNNPPCRDQPDDQKDFDKRRLWDAIGDLYLLGRTLIGGFIGLRSGHALNYRLLQQLIADSAAWEEVVFEKEGEVPLSYAPPVRAG